MPRVARLALAVVLATLSGAAPAAADVVDDRAAAVSRGPGDLLILARGDDGTLHLRQGLEGTWRSVGVPISSGPAAAVRRDGAVTVVARAPDRTLTTSVLRGETFGPWETLPGTVRSAPALVARQGTDVVDLFVRGDDDGLYQRSFTPTGGWGEGVGLGGQISAAPGAVSRRPNFVDVYVRGAEDRIYVKGYDGSSWTPFIDTDGGGRTNAAPSAVLSPNGDHQILVRGLDDGFHERRWVEGDSAYGPWTRIDPRPLSSAPSAVVDGDGVFRVFARAGTDLLTRAFLPSGFGSWRSLGRVAAPPPAPQPPAPAPAPVGGGQVSFDAGLSCTPQGGKVPVEVRVRKRSGRAKPRVTRVVFYYRQGKRGRKVARSDRRAPYRRLLPVALGPGTYRVYARIEYKRGKRSGRKTVSRRFAVCG